MKNTVPAEEQKSGEVPESLQIESDIHVGDQEPAKETGAKTA